MRKISSPICELNASTLFLKTEDSFLYQHNFCLTVLRYDGDDTNANTAAPPTITQEIPPPTQFAPPNDVFVPDLQPIEANSDPLMPVVSVADGEEMNEDDQDDGVENWVTEQSNDVAPPTLHHQEPFGGIREDGYVDCLFVMNTSFLRSFIVLPESSVGKV